LSTEKEATLHYKGENGIMRKQFKALPKEIENHLEEIKLKEKRQNNLKNTLDHLAQKHKA